jgi:e3 binding domain
MSNPNQPTTPADPVNPTAATEPLAATPEAQAHADATGVDLNQVTGTGAGGIITKADVTAAAPAAAGPALEDEPEWSAKLESLPVPQQITLASPVHLYDMTTGKQFDIVGEGPLVLAFKSIVAGVEYLVTQVAADLQLPHGVKADEVAAATAPPPAPAVDPAPVEPPPPAEWQTNLHAQVQTFNLLTDVHSFDMVSGDQVDIVAAGPLVAAFTTKASGTDYLVTQLAYDQGLGHGIKAADVATATAPVAP